jgi:folate-binding protein YgfZ
MTHAKTALLADRGVVRVDGSDAEKLLQGIVTSDVELLAKQPAIHAALLTPQGKILFEFFVARDGDGFVLETAKDQAAGLARRLTMYKLRAKVDIEDVSEHWDVWASWGSDSIEGPWMSEAEAPKEDLQITDMDFMESITFRDPRFWDVGSRWIVYRRLRTPLRNLLLADSMDAAEADDYHAYRISLGVPEGGKDYVLGDTFPHEANMDLLNGVSFSKGCFVGQEVVSRMQHRGTARKRIVIVEGDKSLETGTAITAGQATIGTIGSVAGNRGLALVRLDRVEEMQRKGEKITAAGTALTVQLPAYMTPAVPAATP